jgi:hypothetical protein
MQHEVGETSPSERKRSEKRGVPAKATRQPAEKEPSDECPAQRKRRDKAERTRGKQSNAHPRRRLRAQHDEYVGTERIDVTPRKYHFSVRTEQANLMRIPTLGKPSVHSSGKASPRVSLPIGSTAHHLRRQCASTNHDCHLKSGLGEQQRQTLARVIRDTARDEKEKGHICPEVL